MVDLTSVPKLSNRQKSKMSNSSWCSQVRDQAQSLQSRCNITICCLYNVWVCACDNTHTVLVGVSSVPTVEVCIQPCLHVGTSGQSLRSVRVFTSLTLHKRPFPRRTRKSAGYSAVNKDLCFSKTNPGSPSFTGTPYACSLNIIQYFVHYCTDMSNIVSRFPRNKLDV